jgi:endonuclease-8
MPEGDTIVRIATALRPDLVGRVITGSRCRWDGVVGGVVGTTVDGIDTVGKHLLVRFSDGTALRVHLGLHGTWHVYAPGERWKLGPQHLAVTLETADDVFVCFDAPTVERVRQKELPGHRVLSALGPDLLANPDFAEIVRRTRTDDARPIAVVLLDQHVACGLGNVYKSEVPFLLGLDPHRPAGSLDDATWERVWRLGAKLLAENADRPRRTREGREKTWVYGRGGKPCFTCGTAIRSTQDGDPPRTTYWCPKCQT